MIDETLGVVLAGGLSSRMKGREKTLIALGGKPLIAHVIERLVPQVGALVINANGDPGRFGGFGAPVIADSFGERHGPLAGVLAGLDHAAREGFSQIVTAAGDTPYFPRDLAATLARGADQAGVPIALAATRVPGRGISRHPTFGFWPVRLADDLRRQLENGVRKVVVWADAHGATTIEFDAGPPDPFFNVNTPEDLEAAEKLLSGFRE